MAWWVVLGRLLLATVLSSSIGFERERAGRSAGLRTYSLVGLGSGMFTIVSIIGFESGDDARIAAQIVSGVGFLGAGAIFRDGGSVSGLTTAAGLWAAAAIGIASGSGAYTVAVFGTLIVLMILATLRLVTESMARKRALVPAQIDVNIERMDHLASIRKSIQKIHDSVEELQFKRTGESTGRLTIAVHPDQVDLAVELAGALKGVRDAKPLSPLYWVHREKKRR